MQNPTMACLAALPPLPPVSPAGVPGRDGLLFALWAVNFLAAVFGAFFLFRRTLDAAPRDLADAARIDGCGFWAVYWHVALPLMRPALGLIGVCILIAACDDALAPLIDARGAISPALYAFHASARGISMGAGSFGLAMAGCLLLIPPVMAIFFSTRPGVRKRGTQGA